MRNEIPLESLITTILQEMKSAEFSSGTIELYRRIFKRLSKLAKNIGIEHHSADLGRVFIEDSNYVSTGEYNHARYCYHYRCIQFIESYIETGKVDWTPQRRPPKYPLSSEEFIHAKGCFEKEVDLKGLKVSTKECYSRIVHYYLRYLEERGCDSLSKIKNGDTIAFITFICTEHFKPTSLGSFLPGLRMFLKMFESSHRFEIELPERIPKKSEILEIYTDEEHKRICHYLENSDISHRDKAICLLALEAGLRAIDICKIKIQDIDWHNDCIHIVQEKTKRTLNIPLKASYGNAIADYLLTERPVSDSDNLFLHKNAPFAPFRSKGNCRDVLFKAVTGAQIEANGRSYGTRITRHSTASRMLRHGVPLPVISEALGHGNPNSAMIYLTTEDVKLAECTLPLPSKGGSK